MTASGLAPALAPATPPARAKPEASSPPLAMSEAIVPAAPA
jgi:hypothetical protein